MPHPRQLARERITTIRFRIEATVDHVTTSLLEAVGPTDLFLLTVVGDGNDVYPSEPRSPTGIASSWRVELFWRDDASDMVRHLESFLGRAALFLDCPDGIRVVAEGTRRNRPPRRQRNRAAYGLDGGFGNSLQGSDS